MIRYLLPAMLLVAAVGCGGPAAHDGPPGAAPGGRPSGPPPGAREQLTPAQRLDQTMGDLTVRLKLTPEKAKEVRAILKTGEDKKDKLFAQGERSDNPREMEKVFELVHQVDLQTQRALGKVLTGNQMDEYKDYLKEQRERFETGKKFENAPGASRPSGRPGGGPGGM